MSSSPREEARDQEAPKLVTIPQIPELLEAAGLKRVGAARIRQLAQNEDWPKPVFEDGRTRIFEWSAIERFFRTRPIRQGERNDLKPSQEEASDGRRQQEGLAE
ncbi:hypothetical protein [Streptomyces sp. OR43]|uniref:hypothetical protein n=1 Tax=Streptomyces sp. or43 TaxID=2478957 RepID=UPI0011CDF44B|nr:hypothetical protein [Streptomyces sp. or43]TXS34929.1 hypothetical protein EAO72_40365 [Streptomyces sp. or43]